MNRRILYLGLILSGLPGGTTAVRAFAPMRAEPLAGKPVIRVQARQKLFRGAGIVTAVDPKTGTVTIDHGAIPGLMAAMEMPYKVTPKSLSSDVKKGDQVTFEVDGKDYTIVSLATVRN